MKQPILALNGARVHEASITDGKLVIDLELLNEARVVVTAGPNQEVSVVGGGNIVIKLSLTVNVNPPEMVKELFPGKGKAEG